MKVPRLAAPVCMPGGWLGFSAGAGWSAVGRYEKAAPSAFRHSPFPLAMGSGVLHRLVGFNVMSARRSDGHRLVPSALMSMCGGTCRTNRSVAIRASFQRRLRALSRCAGYDACTPSVIVRGVSRRHLRLRVQGDRRCQGQFDDWVGVGRCTAWAVCGAALPRYSDCEFGGMGGVSSGRARRSAGADYGLWPVTHYP